MRISAGIAQTSFYLPEKAVTNADLAREFPELTEESILRKTGIRKRHVTTPDVIGSDLGFHAASQLFEKDQDLRASIDFLLFCTQGLDYKGPASACILQDRLQLSKNCGAIDIPMGCTGFLNGLSLAKGLVETEQATNVLLITAETANLVIHPSDHELRMLFGDAGAATVITGKSIPDFSIGKFVHGSDGTGAENLIVRRSNTRDPIDPEWLDEHDAVEGLKLGRLHMNGLEIFSFSMRVVPPLVRAILEKENLHIDQIDHFIFHQANEFMLKTLRKKLNIPEEKFIICMEDFGNTVSCTIPIALHEAKKNNTFKKGDKILLAAFGIGYSWNATIITV